MKTNKEISDFATEFSVKHKLCVDDPQRLLVKQAMQFALAHSQEIHEDITDAQLTEAWDKITGFSTVATTHAIRSFYNWFRWTQ